MIRRNLQQLYDELAAKSKDMRQAQTEYFDGARRGYKEPHKLEKARAREAELKEWIKGHWENRNNPDTYEQHEPPQLKEYLHMMHRVVYMLQQQAIFYSTRDSKQMQKCRELEKEVDRLVKKKNEIKQHTLF